MVTNRSVPADTVLPHITYRDVATASAWLTAAFGFTEHYRYGPPGAPRGAQMHLGDAWIMLDAADPGQQTPAELGYGTQSLTVFVPDVDAHYEKARSASATIVEDLHETVYGERQYSARDLDGHHWLFSTHARDVSPTEWGAAITTQPPQPLPNTAQAVHGPGIRRHKLTGDVHLLLISEDGQLLFGRRQSTGYEDGAWHVPAGHLEAGEPVITALIREAREEIGVSIAPEHVEFTHIMHNAPGGGRAAFFFTVHTWGGVPENLEPHKCSELAWFPFGALPAHMIGYCRVALEHVNAGQAFSLYGW